MELKEIDGSFYIVDENGEEKATIGDIIIFTADEKNNTLGELRAVEVVKNQEYRLTIVLDPEYLASPETVYPIRIDPTIEITYDNNGAGAIEDVTINSLKGSSGTSKSLSVGLREKYGISRILMKFPGLDLSQIGAHTKITNATVELRDLLCEGTYLTVSCHAFAGNEWTESTANWSNVSPNSISTFLSSQTISYYNGVNLSPKHRYSFDITEVVKGWKTGNYNQNKGIIFKASSTLENGSTYDCRTIASYNRSSNKPTLTVTYDSTPSSYQLITDGTYYLNNKYSGNYLKHNSSTIKGESGLLQSLGNSIQWEIRNVDGGYVIYSATDRTKYLGVSSSTTSSAVEVVTVSDASIPSRCIWSLTMASNGSGYHMKNNYNARYLYTGGQTIYTSETLESSNDWNFGMYVWRVVGVKNYGNTDTYTLRELENGFTINDMVLAVGDYVIPTVNKCPEKAIWSAASDFIYTYVDGSDKKFSINSVSGGITASDIGIATIQAKHKVTNQVYAFKVYADRYMWELVNRFMFSEDSARLIRSLYVKVDEKFPLSTEMRKAWKCARLLGGIVYGHDSEFDEFEWNNVAGEVCTEGEEKYFVETLGYKLEEYNQLRNDVIAQQDNKNVIDFAHLQIALAARLAYRMSEDGSLSNVYLGADDEIVSYFAGWLGDATIIPNGTETTSMKNDDYCADLDAENISRLIVGRKNSIDAFNSYYCSLSSAQNRADIFLSYITYEYVEEKVFYYLIDKELEILRNNAAIIGNQYEASYYSGLLMDKEYHWEIIRTKYPDTYNFLQSLKNGLDKIVNCLEN